VKWDLERGDVVVFDWEFAWAGMPLFDLGMMRRWGTSPAFDEGLARGYTRVAGRDALPRDWRRRSELLDLFNLVGFLDSEHDRPRCHADVLARVDTTLRQRM